MKWRCYFSSVWVEQVSQSTCQAARRRPHPNMLQTCGSLWNKMESCFIVLVSRGRKLATRYRTIELDVHRHWWGCQIHKNSIRSSFWVFLRHDSWWLPYKPLWVMINRSWNPLININHCLALLLKHTISDWFAYRFGAGKMDVNECKSITGQCWCQPYAIMVIDHWTNHSWSVVVDGSPRGYRPSDSWKIFESANRKNWILGGGLLHRGKSVGCLICGGSREGLFNR